MKRLTTEAFIAKARAVHGERYDYTRTKYVNARTCVEIACSQHGGFLQRTRGHLQGRGCPQCATSSRIIFNTKTTEQFIVEAREIHGERYCYKQANYAGTEEAIVITCLEHGNFTQTPHAHLKGQGCPKCGKRQGNIGRPGGGPWSASSWGCRQNGRRATLYIIELTGENELFYKVGISFNLSGRFSRRMPYRWRTVALYKSYNVREVFELEKAIHRQFKTLSYKPQKAFSGYTECFSSAVDILNTLPPGTFFLKNRPVV